MTPLLLAAAGRLDWGLGNPNKTGALIALLIPIVWGLRDTLERRRPGGPLRSPALFGGAWAGTLALLTCLILTESRGAILATVLAAAIFAGFASRPWPRRRALALAALPLLALLVAAPLGVSRRLDPTFAAGDTAVLNRIPLWKSAPAMMAAAPDGWGPGRAGPAYGLWFQEVSNNQPYRVLVSGHLTWLTEHSTAARFAYLSAWITALLLAAALARRHPWILALLAGQAAAWQFSDVQESAWVAAPTVAAAALAGLLALRHLPTRAYARRLALGVALGASVLGSLLLAGARDALVQKAPGHIRLAGDGLRELAVSVTPGATAPSPREWRELRPDAGTRPDLTWWETDTAPAPSRPGATLLLFNAASAPPRAAAFAALEFIAPQAAPDALIPENYAGRVTVHFGEWGRRPHAEAWARRATIRIHEGEGDYLAGWPSHAALAP